MKCDILNKNTDTCFDCKFVVQGNCEMPLCFTFSELDIESIQNQANAHKNGKKYKMNDKRDQKSWKSKKVRRQWERHKNPHKDVIHWKSEKESPSEQYLYINGDGILQSIAVEKYLSRCAG